MTVILLLSSMTAFAESNILDLTCKGKDTTVEFQKSTTGITKYESFIQQGNSKRRWFARFDPVLKHTFNRDTNITTLSRIEEKDLMFHLSFSEMTGEGKLMIGPRYSYWLSIPQPIIVKVHCTYY